MTERGEQQQGGWGSDADFADAPTRISAGATPVSDAGAGVPTHRAEPDQGGESAARSWGQTQPVRSQPPVNQTQPMAHEQPRSQPRAAPVRYSGQSYPNQPYPQQAGPVAYPQPYPYEQSHYQAPQQPYGYAQGYSQPGQPVPRPQNVGPVPVYGHPGAPMGMIDPVTGEALSDKSKVAAGFLQFFLGFLGIGRFYVGHTAIGAVQLGLFLFGCLTSILIFGIFIIWGVGLWALVDAILMWTGSVRDAQGRKLR